VNGVVFVIAVVFGLMLAEDRVSRNNQRWLRKHGAIEPPGDVFVALAILYPAAFLLMGAEGVWRASTSAASAQGGPAWAASGVVLFVASKALKYWAVHALGRRWSFRVLVIPGEPLVTSGPYRYVAHPNYIAVVGELAGTAMMVGARIIGPVMLVAFGAALVARVKFEERALSR